MVKNCVAYGCSKEQVTGHMIPFHSFPFKRPDILELWVKAIRRENWYPSKMSRICGEHFTENDYKLNTFSTIKKLKPNAVPSIFNFTKHVPLYVQKRKILKEEDKEIIKPINKIITNDITIESNIIISTIQLNTKIMKPELIEIPTVNKVDVATQTAYCFTRVTDLQRRKLKTLQQKLNRKHQKLSKLKSRIKEISEGCSKKKLDAALKKYFQSRKCSYIIKKNRRIVF